MEKNNEKNKVNKKKMKKTEIEVKENKVDIFMLVNVVLRKLGSKYSRVDGSTSIISKTN